MNLKYDVLKLGIGCLRAIYVPMKLQRKQNMITIISRQSREESLDIGMLSEEIRKRCPEMECRVMVKFIEQGTGSKIRYALHMISQMNAMAKSKAVVLDGYCIAASVLNHRKGTEIVQIWHSMAAIKKFGRQTIDKEAGHSSRLAETLCMHRNYNHVICPSSKTGDFFCQGFGCKRDRLVQLCLPRIDYIKKQCSRKKNQNETDKEVILYAPTFRKNDGLKVRELFQTLNYDRFILVVKPHPLYEESFENIVNEMGLQGKVLVDSDRSTFDWLGTADRVISDYSAVAVESLVTGKPLYFYVYDIEDYEKNTGLNVNPLKEVPSITAKTGEELNALLEGEYDWDTLNRFRDDYLTADTENCTEKLAEYIIGVANGNA